MPKPLDMKEKYYKYKLKYENWKLIYDEVMKHNAQENHANEKCFLCSKQLHNEDLISPKKNFYYYIDIIKDYISNLYYKVFSQL